jgi:hypothetical protein
MPKLILARGTTLIREYALDERGARIGRGPDNEIRPDDPTISRNHAAVALEEGGAVVRDLGSRNGTLVNGEKVAKRLLRHGDIIEVGQHQIRYLSEGVSRAKETMVLSMPPAAPTGTGFRPTASIKRLAGAEAGKVVELTKAFTPVGTFGNQVIVIVRRSESYSVVSFGAGAASISVNGRAVDSGAHVLRDHDLVEVGGAKVEFRLGTP